MRKNKTLEVATSRPFIGMDKPALRTEQTARYTPGPWQVNSGMVETTAGIPIALMDRKPDNGTQPTERDANAKLIAAAPEMLEALLAIESCLAPEDSDYAAQKVRAAIHKATGE